MTNSESKKPLLTEREAARILNVCPRTVYSLRDAGKLSCVKFGRSVRYRIEELERFIRDSEECKEKGAC